MCSKPAIPEHAAAPACPRLRAAAEILRPVNCALTFASVLLGGWLGSHTLSPTLLIAGLSASLIMAGGNVLNDLRDREADRINKPLRPLPSGRLPARIGRLLAVLCTALGLALAFLLPRPATLVAAFAVTALVAYNVHLKGIPLLGNLLVSLLCGLSFLYGGAAVGNAPQALIPAAFALLYHLGLFNRIPGAFALKDRVHSLGLGFYANTQIPGPIRLELGATDRRDIHIHLSFGYAF